MLTTAATLETKRFCLGLKQLNEKDLRVEKRWRASDKKEKKILERDRQEKEVFL